MRPGGEPFFGPDQDARVPVGAPDAPHGDVRGVAHEVRALVAALQCGAVEVPDRLLEDRLATPVLDYQFSPDNVDAPDVIEIHTPPIANLLEHQLLVVEALGAQERYGQGEGLDPRGSPRPRPRLHSLYTFDLARRPHHGHPGVQIGRAHV